MEIMKRKKKTLSSFIWSFIPRGECVVIIFLCLLQYDESEKRKEMAKNSLERYMHYYERWASNQSVCF
jgi:hypothetical protein